MRITGKVAKEMLEVLDEVKEELKKEQKSPYPYAEWERKREKVKEKLRRLPEYVRKAASVIEAVNKTGRPKGLDLTERTILFLFARLISKSNRDVELMLGLLSPLIKKEISYKTVERLYSDEEVRLVLHNLFILLVRDEGVSGNFSGDGTGYSLTITKHYRTDPKKKSKDYRYTFRLIDLDTGMYAAFGYSNVSEMNAFNEAMSMAEELGIVIDKIRLDKYYSSRKILNLFGNRTTVFVIPKKNISKIGFQWSRVIRKIIENPIKFLNDYFMRNISESGFSSDKRRFGGVIRQRREDRKETAMFSVALLHNIFFVRVRKN